MPRQYTQYLKFAALGLVILLAMALLLITSAPTQASTSAAAPSEPSDNFTCTPVGVAAYTSRVHVRCNPVAPGNIGYFAVCTTDSASASRFLSVFTTAKVTGKNLVIFYTPGDTSGTACGCQTGDCRLAWGAEIQQ